MPTRRVDWIRDGVIGALAYSARGGRGVRRRVHPARRQPGARPAGRRRSIAIWWPRTERGLLLTCLWYIREVDPATLLLTGLTRDGVYLVEDGEVVGAVNNFRFNERPLDLLRRVTEAAPPSARCRREWKDWFTRAAMPPMRVPDFNMSLGQPGQLIPYLPSCAARPDRVSELIAAREGPRGRDKPAHCGSGGTRQCLMEAGRG